MAITSRLAGAETMILAASSNTVEFQVYGGKGITSFDVFEERPWQAAPKAVVEKSA